MRYKKIRESSKFKRNINIEDKSEPKKSKKGLSMVLNIYRTFPMTSFFVIVITILNMLSLVIDDNILYFKIYTGMIFPLFLFFSIESKYFNVKFKNKKDARSLKIWNYLYGFSITLIFLIIFIKLYTYETVVCINQDGETSILKNSIIQRVEYPNYIVQYGLIIFILLSFLLALSRIKTNLNLKEDTYFKFGFKKYIKLFLIFTLIIGIETIIPELFTFFNLPYDKATKVVFVIYNLLLPIVVYPIILNVFINTNKISYTNKSIKKFVIYLVAPLSLIYSICFIISNIIIQFNDYVYVDATIILDYVPIFYLMILIGVGLKMYLKEYLVVKNKESKILDNFENIKKENLTILVDKNKELEENKLRKDENLITNEKERKYIKILSELVLIPLVLSTILPIIVIIKIGINKVGLFTVDIAIVLIFLFQFLFIFLYLIKNQNIILRHINYFNFLIFAVLIGNIIYFWSLIGFSKVC